MRVVDGPVMLESKAASAKSMSKESRLKRKERRCWSGGLNLQVLVLLSQVFELVDVVVLVS